MHTEVKRREYVSSIHRELEIERDWYKHGLSKIIDMIVWNEYLNDSEKLVEAKSIVMSYLDGEPTTADELNENELDSTEGRGDYRDGSPAYAEQPPETYRGLLDGKPAFGGDIGTDADYSKEEE